VRLLLRSLCLCFAASACGYDAGLRVAEHHDSVGIEIFGNESYERDLEPELHDQMTKVLRDQSDARLVDPREARAVIRGTLTAFHRRGGIRDSQNKLLETGVYIEVTARLFVGGNETPVRSATSSVWIGYTLDDSGNERAARDQALRHLAEGLILQLLGPGNDA
jgi:Lipopolysaccharide-assembly